MIKCVIFDMDGTILDSERFCFNCYQEVCCKYGINITLEVYKKMIGNNHEDSKKYLTNLYNNFDYDKISSEVEELENKKIEAGIRVEVKKGYHELINFLKINKIQTALATSTIREKAINRLSNANILKDFTTIIGGDEVSKGKPDPEIYEKIVQLLDIPKGQVLVLEDSVNGIKSAYAANLKVVMIPDLIEPNDVINKYIYSKAKDLASIIQMIEGEQL